VFSFLNLLQRSFNMFFKIRHRIVAVMPRDKHKPAEFRVHKLAMASFPAETRRKPARSKSDTSCRTFRGTATMLPKTSCGGEFELLETL
jgi:hypothetical protein